jgi:very-long-chain enoyl-CoA reductase
MSVDFIFTPPPNLFVTAMSVVSVVALAIIGFLEINGHHLQYSKFWNVNSNEGNSTLSRIRRPLQVRISSRIGMLILYTPAILAGLVSFAIFPNDSFRFLLVKAALTLHFLKRDFDVLFIHKYSGGMILDSVLLITSSYTMATITMLYAQNLTQGISNPSIDLVYPGILLFLVGIIGNFFHHISLSKLRENGDRVQYKIPRGGMFDFVICPHYLFEILIFVGIAFISQTLYAFCFVIGTTIYLIGRSYATRRWYLSKFDDFPKNVKALIPFVF